MTADEMLVRMSSRELTERMALALLRQKERQDTERRAKARQNRL